MTDSEFIARLEPEELAAFISIRDRLMEANGEQQQELVAAHVAALASVKSEAEAKENTSKDALDKAQSDGRDATDAAVLSVQQTYDAILQKAQAAWPSLTPEDQALLGPIIAEALSHTSAAREEANAKKKTELQAQLAALG